MSSTLQQPAYNRTVPYAWLFEPQDCDDAYATWKASCGPCSYAAVTRQAVGMVRPMFPKFPRRAYANQTDISDALHKQFPRMWQRYILNNQQRTLRLVGLQYCNYGLAFLQWEGPWLNDGVPIAAAYQQTHWVGVAQIREHGQMIYDVNGTNDQGTRGQWMPVAYWEAECLPRIVAEIPRATGGYFVRWVAQIVSPDRSCDVPGK